jgi:hypothetical protein
MDKALTLEFGSFGLNETKGLSFLSFPSKRSTKQLTGSTEEAVRNIAAILDQLLTAAIETRTAVDFIALRDSTFPHYAGVMISLATLTRAIVPPAVLERLHAESLNEQEAEFRDGALPAFGSAIRDQAIFTVWTLRKINELSRKLTRSTGVVPEERRGDDAAFLNRFTFHGLRTRFHLDCLTTSMRHGQPVFPEVLGEISNGLRSAVDAYAWMRQFVELRYQGEDPILPFIDLDEEDREFVNASARDMAADLAVHAD